MTEALPNLPEFLREAAKIFLEELGQHVVFFGDLCSELEQSNEAQANVTIQAKTRLIAEKFHLIKGASGFLNFTELKNNAGENETFFRTKPVPGTFPEILTRLNSAHAIIKKSHEQLTILTTSA